MTIVQWVNLEKDPAYAQDPDVGSVDRCGPLSIKAMFDKDNIPLNFTVKLVPSGGDNVQYSAAELAPGRNPNFKMPAEISGLGSTKETVLDAAIRLPAAGGNKYKVEAKDANGTVVTSVEIEAKRKLYYQYMYMKDADGSVQPHPLTQLEDHCKANHVVLTKAGANKEIPFKEVIAINPSGTYNYNHFTSDIGRFYDLAAPLKKVGCVTVLSNYIASMQESNEIKRSLSIGSAPNPNCIITGDSVTLKIDQFLWHGLDSIDDRRSRWFVSCKVEYMPAGGKDPGDIATLWIDRSKVSVAGKKHFAYGGYRSIEIDMDANLKAILAKGSGRLAFTLKVNTAGFLGGFSYDGGGFSLTTCRTKSWWGDVEPSDSDQTWNHEVGHRMGMTAYGDKDHRATNPRYFEYKPKLPDSPKTLYGENRKINDKDHQGPHCENGATYNSATRKWSGKPLCVMFGANRTEQGDAHLDYCNECKPIVRKLDLSFPI